MLEGKIHDVGVMAWLHLQAGRAGSMVLMAMVYEVEISGNDETVQAVGVEDRNKDGKQEPTLIL